MNPTKLKIINKRNWLILSIGLLVLQISFLSHVMALENPPSYLPDQVPDQDRIITGQIVNEINEPLFGVTILVEGTTIGTTTDFDGKFRLSIPQGETVLVISYLGYKSQKIAVGLQSSFNIQLESEDSELDEFVVVGYGTQKRRDITGSIASVRSEEIDLRPITSIQEGLQGLVPGLNIAQRSSSPGELATVSIRGLGSITAGTEPLWVVDGFPTDQRNAQSINPTDIASVEILKDASSTAIYGSRGANGVIIITTKSGKSGASTLDLTVTSGVATVPNYSRFKVLNAEEYVQFHKEKNNGVVPDFIANNWDGVTDTDWQDLIFQSASFQNYVLSASGGSDKVNYLFSGNYINQQGVVIGEGQKKYSARAKINYMPSNKLTIGINLAPNITTIGRNSPATDAVDWSSLYAQSILLAPILPVRRENGTYSMNSDLPGSLPVGNPLETAQNYDFNATLFRFLGGLDINYEIAEGLNINSNISTNIGSDRSETYYLPTIGQTVPIQLSPVSLFNTGQSLSIDWLNENTISYRKQINEHSFDLLGGFTLQKFQFNSVGASVNELQVPGVRNVNIGNADNLVGTNSTEESSIVSYLGRINYSFKDKYLITGTVRTDGSSVFGQNNRYQTFGSFALGWRFTEEAFMKNLELIDDGKFRVSYGSTGSNAIPPYASRATLGTTRQSFGNTNTFGTFLGNPGNPNLTWETSEQLNIGLDLNLFKNKVFLVIDYFNNETTSLLLTKGIVPSSGYSQFLTNIGSMRNKGFEFAVNAQIINKGDWEWNLGGNLTTNNQEILELGGETEIQNFFGALRRVVGGPLQQMRGPKVIGIARDGDDQTGQPLQTPGALIYEDVNGDGTISNFLGPDGQLIGDTNIDLIYGINSSLKYKNWEFSALFNGQSGASVYDFFLIQVGAAFRQTNLSHAFWYEGRYISEQQPGDGKTPAANGFDSSLGTVSSLGVQRTDFFRIRNVTLNYNLPVEFYKRLGLSRARIFTSIENLYTFTNFIGGNPEARRASAGGPALIGGSQIASVTDGRELGLNSPPGLPLPRTWTLGINVTF
ncbi:TonB-linked outer membrane protein, SusC/RagA family [Aquiflexum balticum DSM 16537]|uniref:TonB-linked outer membrane protein, SusC/RagA family n=1 Tax=Aquiflexum balticum DSM 16537 TaxID=758820 RepID=A0A1W2H7Q1_9BACT|nr:TonB-dependent receptor [Aquiflexum balticum]SMD44889.1 TonB-linked outer membrane protein, SusC/RagA family [Aquiflexum balticum DSM 16537]